MGSMFNWLSNITITCFAASYGVTLALEASRLFFRAPIRLAVMLGFAMAGWFAHTAYLLNLAQQEITAGNQIALFSDWHAWCMLAAWIMAGAYLGLTLRRPKNNVGLFILPLILLFVGIAVACADSEGFPRAAVQSVWGIIHGVCLLIGTVAVMLGFAAGVMYLIQANRLKHKRMASSRIRLPSLEWLQRFNKESLHLSTTFLFLGLLSGIILSFNKHTRITWTDPVILTSTILFLWLAGVSIFEYFYRPARQGHKVAYLTVCNFVFMTIALATVFLGDHGGATVTWLFELLDQSESLAMVCEAGNPDPVGGGG